MKTVQYNWKGLVQKLKLILILLTVGLIGELYGQIYPVWVSAMPPTISSGTVYLGDFAHIEATGGRINFMVELRDPVEQTRQVHFRLHVIRNGTTVMMTDPSFVPMPLTLQKGFPIMINGADLAIYFDLNHLVGVSGYSIGNVLPEDYYSICIEVIDLVRQEVISERICASGFLKQLSPPLLYFPQKSVPLSMGQSVNLMFNWQLTGLSLLYNSNISYIFELRELAEGLENVQEYFENNTLIYQTEIQNNSLIYGVGLPVLVKDKKYIWRVRALARGDNGQELVGYFHNNGISEIWDFTLPKDLGRDQDFCHATPPKLAKNQTPISQVFVDDVIHVGHFDLIISDVQNASGDAVKGSGSILIPFLDIEVEVNFDNLKVNEKRDVFGGQINAIRQDNWLLNIKAKQDGSLSFSDIGPISDVDVQSVTALSRKINTDSPNQLPLSLREPLLDLFNVEMPYDLIINEMWFTPQGARFNAMMMVPNGHGGFAKFGVAEVGIDDSGFDIANLNLYLAEHASMPAFEGDSVHIVAIPGETDPKKGSFIAFDCSGFKEFNLQGKYRFDKSMLVRASNVSVPASASLHIQSTTWGNSIGEVSMQDFAIPGLDDWRFEVVNGFVDFSAIENLTNLQLPSGYTITDNLWRGFYIKELKVQLPQELRFGNNNALEMMTSNLVIDHEGVSFSGKGYNLMPLGVGNAGGWGISFEELQLNIAKNAFKDAEIKGQIISVPIQDTLDFSGKIFREESAGDYALDLIPLEDIDIPFLHARIEPDMESLVSIRKEPPFCVAEWKPYANINGALHVTMSEESFAQFGGVGINQKIEQIKDSLNADNEFVFDLQGVAIKGFKINHPKLPENRFFGIDRVSLSSGGVSLANVKLSVEGVDLLEGTFELDGDQSGLGLGFHVALDSFGVRPKFWALNESEKGAGPYKLAKIEIDVPKVPKKAFQCACVPALIGSHTPDYCQPPIPVRQGAVLQVDQVVQVGHFEMEITSLNGNNGSGKIAMPFLGGQLDVDFSNVSLDGNGMVVNGIVQSSFASSFEGLKEEALTNAPGLFEMKSISNDNAFLSDLKLHMKKLGDQFQCPVSISSKVHELVPIDLDGSFEFILMGINFSAKEAKVNCMVIFKTPHGETLKFGLAGLTLRPDGFDLDGLNIFLAEEAMISGYDGKQIKLLKSQPGDPGSGSYLSFDCDGFNTFNLKGIYTFDKKTIYAAANVANPVEAHLDIVSKYWDDFYAVVHMPPFAIPGLEGWRFEVVEATADFSATSNLMTMVFPGSYGLTNPGWQGFFLNRVSITMPDDLKFGRKENLTFETENLLIDHYGVSGSVVSYDVVSLPAKRKDQWAISIREMELEFLRNRFVEAKMQGLIQGSSFEGKIAYQGRLFVEPVTEETPNGFYGVDLSPTSFVFSGNSMVNITAQAGSLVALRKRAKLGLDGRQVFVNKAPVYEYRSFTNANTSAVIELPADVFKPSLLKYRFGGSSFLLDATGFTKWHTVPDNGIKEIRIIYHDNPGRDSKGHDPFFLIRPIYPSAIK